MIQCDTDRDTDNKGAKDRHIYNKSDTDRDIDNKSDADIYTYNKGDIDRDINKKGDTDRNTDNKGDTERYILTTRNMKRHSSFKERWKGSTKSLAGFRRSGQGQASLSRQESLTSLAEREEVLYREEVEEKKPTLRRNLSRKVRETFARYNEIIQKEK